MGLTVTFNPAAVGVASAVTIDAPFLVPGYVWLRGEQLVGADGTAITTWQNEAQITHPATKTGTITMQTVGGFRVARFNNGRFDFSGYDSPQIEVSVFAVFTPTSITPQHAFLHCGGGQGRIQLYTLLGGATPGLNLATAQAILATSLVAGTKYLLEAHVTAANDVSLGLNGAVTRFQLSTAYPGWTLANIRVGQDPAGNQPCYMDLYELFVCPVSQVANMRTYLREYFRTKFSVY